MCCGWIHPCAIHHFLIQLLYFCRFGLIYLPTTKHRLYMLFIEIAIATPRALTQILADVQKLFKQIINRYVRGISEVDAVSKVF